MRLSPRRLHSTLLIAACHIGLGCSPTGVTFSVELDKPEYSLQDVPIATAAFRNDSDRDALVSGAVQLALVDAIVTRDGRKVEAQTSSLLLEENAEPSNQLSRMTLLPARKSLAAGPILGLFGREPTTENDTTLFLQVYPYAFGGGREIKLRRFYLVGPATYTVRLIYQYTGGDRLSEGVIQEKLISNPVTMRIND